MMSSLPAFGQGQTWQDVKASRATSTIYTNTTGKPIQVYITNTLGAGVETFKIGGVTVSPDPSSIASCYIVPNGMTYELSIVGGSSTINTWMELRS